MMRRMNHCTHDTATLESYLDDLKNAAAEGRNFMIEKYARLDNRLPPLSHNRFWTRLPTPNAHSCARLRRTIRTPSRRTANRPSAPTAAANWKPSPTARCSCTPTKWTVP